MSTPIEPLRYNVPIVRKDGTPDPAFQRQLNDFIRSAVDTEVKVQLAKRDAKNAHDAADAAQATADAAVPQTRLINTTSPIAGGGDLTADRTISHVVSGVTASTYGDASHTLTLTVDATGHITAITVNAVSGGGTGTVTTTGSPASGNLAKFSGTTSIVNGDLSGDVTTSGTLATTLAASGVTAATYGDATHSAQITVDAKGRITSASNVAISGAGGGTAWTELDFYDATASGATAGRSVSVSGYNEVMVVFHNVVLAASGWRVVQVSVDGGSTFFASANQYANIDSNGVGITTDSAMFSHSTATASARYAVLTIPHLKMPRAFKPFTTPDRATASGVFTASASAITDIRALGWTAGLAVTNMNSGQIAIYAR